MQAIQATFDDLGTRLPDVTFVVVDLETTGGSPAAVRHHRDRRGQGARRRGARRVPDARQPGRADPGVHLRPHRHHRRHGARRAAHRVAPARPSSSSRPAASSSPTTPASTSASSRRLRAAPARRGRDSPVLDTLDAGAPAGDAATSRRTTGSRRWPGCSARPRLPTTARCTTRAPRSTCSTASSSASATSASTRSRSSPATARGSPRAATQAVPRRPAAHAPGVYLFKDGDGRVLYVGTSRDIRIRVRSYFTASEQRSRMAEMVRLAHAGHPVVCQTPSRPRCASCASSTSTSRGSTGGPRTAATVMWVKLTQRALPAPVDRQAGARTTAPTTSGRSGPGARAQSAIDAVHEVVPLRQCTATDHRRGRPPVPSPTSGRCGAPCTGAQSEADYAVWSSLSARALLRQCPSRRRPAAVRGSRSSPRQERFEDAGTSPRPLPPARPRCRPRPTACPADPVPRGGGRPTRTRPVDGSCVCVRYGRLAGTVVSPRGADPMVHVRTLQATAEVVLAPSPEPPRR